MKPKGARKKTHEVAKSVDIQAKQADEDGRSEDEPVEELIPGTLDEAPPVGALVKVLYDDDRWYPAKVTASCGSIATILYPDGEKEEVDCSEHAVRLFDYVSEDMPIFKT